jgi:adenylylsulfate kinase-like enzyme
MIYWFTGQPGHGKTVLATALQHELDNAFHIDGDDIRAIFDNKDYSEAGRRKNIELAQNIAKFYHHKGNVAIVSLVSPYKDQRDYFKEAMGDNIQEIYVYTSSIRGREQFHVQNYEQPVQNFIHADTTNEDQYVSFQKIKKQL